MGNESIKELRKLSKIERDKKLNDLREELLLLQSKNSMGGALDNPSRIRIIKKVISRLKTIEREEQLRIRVAK